MALDCLNILMSLCRAPRNRGHREIANAKTENKYQIYNYAYWMLTRSVVRELRMAGRKNGHAKLSERGRRKHISKPKSKTGTPYLKRREKTQGVGTVRIREIRHLPKSATKEESLRDGETRKAIYRPQENTGTLERATEES